jgi:23S rRNA pseudouridine1911/1915/1917 synthase
MSDSDESLRFHVDADADGQRIDRFLADCLQSISRSSIQKAIEEGLIHRNGAPVKKRAPVHAGDSIVVMRDLLHRERAPALVGEDIPLTVLFEDEHLVAVNKPAGLVVHPGSGNRHGTLAHALVFHIKKLSSGSAPLRPGIVHRLDKNTSGVLLVAKTDQAHVACANLFASRGINKQYIGFTIGNQPQPHACIDAPVGRARNDPTLFTVRREGKQALTEYWTIGFRSGVGLLRFQLHTGRTHQIRVHCRYAGFPILMDTAYGGGRERALLVAPLERPFAYAALKCFRRQALHARRLEFIHPCTGNRTVIVAPFPDDFAEALNLFDRSTLDELT